MSDQQDRPGKGKVRVIPASFDLYASKFRKKELAFKTGMSERQIFRIEYGENVTRRTALKLCAGVGATLEELFQQAGNSSSDPHEIFPLTDTRKKKRHLFDIMRTSAFGQFPEQIAASGLYLPGVNKVLADDVLHRLKHNADAEAANDGRVYMKFLRLRSLRGPDDAVFLAEIMERFKAYENHGTLKIFSPHAKYLLAEIALRQTHLLLNPSEVEPFEVIAERFPESDSQGKYDAVRRVADEKFWQGKIDATERLIGNIKRFHFTRDARVDRPDHEDDESVKALFCRISARVNAKQGLFKESANSLKSAFEIYERKKNIHGMAQVHRDAAFVATERGEAPYDTTAHLMRADILFRKSGDEFLAEQCRNAIKTY